MPEQLQDTDKIFFLPDFGSLSSVVRLVLIGQMLAILLVISYPVGENRLEALGLISLFIQWGMLGNAAVLTLLKPWLSKLSAKSAGLTCYFVVLLVTLLASEIAFWSLVPSLVAESERLHFLLRNLAVSAIVGAIALRYLYIHYELKRQLQAESLARLQALQSRIRPHFLFNSMNTIAALIQSKPEVAVETVEDLADLFRVSLMESGRKHSLTSELEIARRYLRIEKLRLGNRLRVEWDVAEAPVNAAILPMTLQPLVENAVYHGIEPMLNGGIVQITCRLREGEVHIRIMNSVGKAAYAQARKGNRIAVDNIRERLKLSYNPPGRMEVTHTASYFTVEIVLPYRRADQ